VSDDIARLAFRKRFPFRVKGTAEEGLFHLGDYRRLPGGAVAHVPGRAAHFPAGEVFLDTYMERDFAIGTSTRPMHSGTQSEVFYEIHRRCPRARKQGDIRSIFARYRVSKSGLEKEVKAGLIRQQAFAWAIQDDARALALYHPNGYPHRGVDALSLNLLLPEPNSAVDEIWIGNRKLKNGDGSAAKPDWVIFRDGDVLAAFYPLAADLGRRVAIRSEHRAGLRVVSFVNYEGRKKTFGRGFLPTIANGFVYEGSTTKRHPTVRAFLRDLRKAEISDTTVLEARRVRYLRGGRELFLWIDPRGKDIKAAAVNGTQVAYPPLSIQGAKVGRVPWLGKGHQHRDLGWWKRFAALPPVVGLEPVSGRGVRPKL
jgi:hypothetical protein